MSWREPPTVVAVGPAAAGQSVSVHAASGPYNHGNHSRSRGGGEKVRRIKFRFGSQKK